MNHRYPTTIFFTSLQARFFLQIVPDCNPTSGVPFRKITFVARSCNEVSLFNGVCVKFKFNTPQYVTIGKIIQLYNYIAFAAFTFKFGLILESNRNLVVAILSVASNCEHIINVGPTWICIFVRGIYSSIIK